jgi:hypothetical protein
MGIVRYVEKTETGTNLVNNFTSVILRQLEDILLKSQLFVSPVDAIFVIGPTCVSKLHL